MLQLWLYQTKRGATKSGAIIHSNFATNCDYATSVYLNCIIYSKFGGCVSMFLIIMYAHIHNYNTMHFTFFGMLKADSITMS